MVQAVFANSESSLIRKPRVTLDMVTNIIYWIKNAVKHNVRVFFLGKIEEKDFAISEIVMIKAL